MATRYRWLRWVGIGVGGGDAQVRGPTRMLCMAGVVACVAMCVPPAANAATLEVPGQYLTIQTAIDAALVGDEVVIADGVYTGVGNKNLDFGGKDIIVRSASGDPNTCVIDCEGDGRGFYFHSGETADAVVRGLTIRNGRATVMGGGVLCESVAPTFEHCAFEANQALFGAGLYATLSALTLDECTFAGNTGSDGGGVACSDGAMALIACLFTSNIAQYAGGGLYGEEAAQITMVSCTVVENESLFGGGLYGRHANVGLTGCTVARNEGLQGGGAYCDTSSTLQIAECTISDNVANHAAGLYIQYSTLSASETRFTGNAATVLGGAVASLYSDLELDRCIMVANSGTNGGGALAPSYSTLDVTRCWISGNSGSTGGAINCSHTGATFGLCVIADNVGRSGAGGVHCGSSSNAVYANCTIVGNRGTGSGGIYCAGSTAAVANCILTGNAPGQIYVASGGGVTVRYSDVEGGWAGVGNFDADPLFRDADGPDDDPNTLEDNDYRLLPGSPCIDAGNNAAVPADAWDLDGDGDTAEPLPVDLSGRPRFVDDPLGADCPWAPDTCGTPPIVDVGAYEYQRDGDCDLNWVIDAADAAQFVTCMGGPAMTLEDGCACGDADGDRDVDLHDFALLQAEAP